MGLASGRKNGGAHRRRGSPVNAGQVGNQRRYPQGGECLSGDDLEHIYAKLGIQSRRELMTMGARLETLIGRKA
jgi:hypothetical protein